MKMLPDERCFSSDKYGCPTLLLRAEHLHDFPSLISWINEQGYGRSTGLLKLRLHPDDRQDSKVLEESIALMKKHFKKKTYNSKTKKKGCLYKPDAQVFLKASMKENIFEYVKCKCTDQETKQFVEKAIETESYTSQSSNCCTEVLKSSGLDGLRAHLFSVLDKLSTYTDYVKNNFEQLKTMGCDSVQNKHDAGTPLIYGAGIQVDPDIPIQLCREFNLTNLKTISDHLDEKFDGIAYPYLYVGTQHTVFPWHIEDGALYSINYLVGGMPKIWYAIPPSFYGVVDTITSNLRLNLAHTSCRALLADHKALVSDPAFFAGLEGVPKVPFLMAVQEPGDFMVTFPFALHSGANLGWNLAIAANFGDMDWIEIGMYAPICTCMGDSQVHISLTNLIRKFRPELLEAYISSPCLLPPPGHPRDLLQHATVGGKVNLESKPKNVTSAAATSEMSRNSSEMSPCRKGSHKETPPVKTPYKMGRTLYCPACSQSFMDNKLPRLKQHINRKHPDKADYLVQAAHNMYAPKPPKTNLKFKCKVCNKILVGSSTHMKIHHAKCHSDLPFEEPTKV